MTNVTQVLPPFNLDDPTTCVLDLEHRMPKQVNALVEAFEVALRTNPDPGALPVVTGWNDITPAIAVNLLRRNPRGSNRRIDPTTVFYYANQMARGDWKATGQPVIVDSNGTLQDAQHRLYAGLISGVTFKTYVVTDVEPIHGLFAYIDNGRSRTAATALQTAGLNGVSPVIAKVIKIGEEVRLGVYNPAGTTKLSRLSPHDYLNAATNYPNAMKSARSAASDWESAVTLLGGRKELVAYLGMRITDLHGEEKADDFFENVMDGQENRNADDPILALLKLAERDAREERPMKRHHMLAAMIKVFNAWHSGQPLGRRWMLAVNEDFPTLDASVPQTEAAQ